VKRAAIIHSSPYCRIFRESAPNRPHTVTLDMMWYPVQIYLLSNLDIFAEIYVEKFAVFHSHFGNAPRLGCLAISGAFRFVGG
jgi:hypothetical protein